MKPHKTYSDGKQSMWELWFLSGLFAFIVLFVIGLCDGSRDFFPYWPLFFGISIINLGAALWKGRTKW